MVAIQKMLGSGIYTIQEASLYARVSPRMMSRWVFGNKAGSRVIVREFDSEEKLISFLDFVQTLAIREIRIQKRIPLLKFRQAVEVAERMGMKFPFARRHCTYLLGDQLVIKPPGEGFVEASGKHRGQRLFTFVELYLENLSFNRNGLANRYMIYSRNDIPIYMSPGIRFGEPLLPSGYSATAIWEAIQAEGGIENTAKAYGIPPEEVEAAYMLFVDHFGKSTT